VPARSGSKTPDVGASPYPRAGVPKPQFNIRAIGQSSGSRARPGVRISGCAIFGRQSRQNCDLKPSDMEAVGLSETRLGAKCRNSRNWNCCDWCMNGTFRTQRSFAPRPKRSTSAVSAVRRRTRYDGVDKLGLPEPSPRRDIASHRLRGQILANRGHEPTRATRYSHYFDEKSGAKEQAQKTINRLGSPRLQSASERRQKVEGTYFGILLS